MNADPRVDASPRPDPWPRVIVFSAFVGLAYAGVSGVVIAAANAFLIDSTTFDDPLGGRHRLGLPRDLKGFLIGAGVACLIAAAVGAALAWRSWRRDNRKLAWGFLIGVPLAAVVSGPLTVFAFGAGVAGADAAGSLLPPQNYVSVVNDTPTTVRVRYCVKQDCTGATSVTLARGHEHHYPAPKDDSTPDEIVVTVPGADNRCALVPSLAPDESGPIEIPVSDADSQTC